MLPWRALNHLSAVLRNFETTEAESQGQFSGVPGPSVLALATTAGVTDISFLSDKRGATCLPPHAAALVKKTCVERGTAGSSQPPSTLAAAKEDSLLGIISGPRAPPP